MRVWVEVKNTVNRKGKLKNNPALNDHKNYKKEQED